MRVQTVLTFVTVLIAALASGTLSLQARERIVLIDEGHGQRFVVGKQGELDLSGLAGLFQAEGLQVRTNGGKITPEVLAGVDGLVISGAFAPFSREEIGAIEDFLTGGGRLSVMLHIGAPVLELLRELHVYVSRGVVHGQENLIENNETNYYVFPAGQHGLTAGIERFRVYGGWALISNDEKAEIVARTSMGAWIDVNMNGKREAAEQQQTLALAIAGSSGKGSFVVFGDDAIFQNRFMSGENKELGRNLAKWLGAGALPYIPAAEKVFL